MHYVGLDVHARRSSLCILDGREGGQAARGPRVVAEADGTGRRRRCRGRSRSATRPSAGTGTCTRGCRRLAERVAVAHPGKLRLIFRSKRKNDRVDAEKLAKLLYLDQVPQVHVPRRRRAGVARADRVRRQAGGPPHGGQEPAAGAAARGRGAATPRRARRLWSKKGLAWLAAAQLLRGRRPAARPAAGGAGAGRSERVGRVTKELDRRADAHPGVALLRTVPGVGPRTAEAFVAYVDDVTPLRPRRSRWAATWGWCRARTARRARTGSGTSPATARRRCGSCCARRRGRRCGAAPR